MEAYDSNQIESKWQQYWAKNGTFKTLNDTTLPKYYVLDMFPYPSGAGLHVGHPLGYIASDIVSRYKRHQGFNVLHPMGFDAFGLPAEQYAIETGQHPDITTEENIKKYKKQLKNIGFSFDWDREIRTSDPDYYKWTQQMFSQLFEHYYCKNTDKAQPILDLISQFEKEGNGTTNAANSQDFSFSADEWKGYSEIEKDEILMNYRLAYRKLTFVNWCEELGTVLANDEVKNGLSERGGHPVVQKPLKQWALRITAYAERLLAGLDEVDFSQSLKTQQTNWIGKSIGATVFFNIKNSKKKVEVFTTRPDTIFGCTFMVLSPEHDFVKEITTDEQKNDIEKYKKQASAKSERERMADAKNVSGCFTGAYALHPFSGEKLPIYIAEYVLAGYGTGAIMAVPAHDERDNKFAKYFDLKIVKVVNQDGIKDAEIGDKVGVMENSDFLNGLKVGKAIKNAIYEMGNKGIGEAKINFKLRDANFSRQRYWGEPYPIIYKDNGASILDKNLPVVLPSLDNFGDIESGKSPLDLATDWVRTSEGMRETDTMPGFAGSSWYFLRYMDPHNSAEAFSQESVNYWQQVDLYIGGAEHAVGHLLYSRFWNQFLFDMGKVPNKEPFKKLINQGMIQGIVESLYFLKEKQNGKQIFICETEALQLDKNEISTLPIHVDFVKDYGTDNSYIDKESLEGLIGWRKNFADAEFNWNSEGNISTKSEVGKMSKRWYNVVNPDDIVERYGADTLRMYEMFLGPLQDAKPWNTAGIEGVFKFLKRFWLLCNPAELSTEKPTEDENRILHQCIKKITWDIDNYSFNTSISTFMTVCNDLTKMKCTSKEVISQLAILISPFAPHISEEIWSSLGNKSSVSTEEWPVFNESYLKKSTHTYPISVNGKMRCKIEMPLTFTEDEVKERVLNDETIQKWMEGKQLRKLIFVKGKIVNLVVG